VALAQGGMLLVTASADHEAEHHQAVSHVVKSIGISAIVRVARAHLRDGSFDTDVHLFPVLKPSGAHAAGDIERRGEKVTAGIEGNGAVLAVFALAEINSAEGVNVNRDRLRGFEFLRWDVARVNDWPDHRAFDVAEQGVPQQRRLRWGEGQHRESVGIGQGKIMSLSSSRAKPSMTLPSNSTPSSSADSFLIIAVLFSIPECR